MYYNLGIVLRKLKLLDESLDEFQKGIDWALERDDKESECLCYGQIGLTYYIMEDTENALQNFEVIFYCGG